MDTLTYVSIYKLITICKLTVSWMNDALIGLFIFVETIVLCHSRAFLSLTMKYIVKRSKKILNRVSTLYQIDINFDNE